MAIQKGALVRALITGGAGFIGSHLAEELLGRGQEVMVYDDLSTGSMGNLAHLKGNPAFSFHYGNILDASKLAVLVREAHAIYHLAAAVGVRYVLDHPLASLETNTRGTENLLRLAAENGNKRVVLASSSEVYGKASKAPFQEDDDCVLGPTTVSRWGYACSKALDEFLALAYYREKGLPVVVLRLFNTVGTRQSARYGMVMPRFISQALAGQPITVYGDGQQVRSFTYVKDVVKAMADIVMAPSAEGQVFNVGTSSETSINDLAEMVRRVLGSTSETVHIPMSHVYGEGFEETRRRVADISKIKRVISYRPETDLAIIIKEIANGLSAEKSTQTEQAKGAHGNSG